jgi:hypothetical protein
MTLASPRTGSKQGKKDLLRRSLREALKKRFSLLYLDLILKPPPDDLKHLIVKLDVADRHGKPH